jgi:hypothetical protein
LSGRVSSSVSADSPRDFGTGASGKAARWRSEIEYARKEQASWERMARNVRDRYRDESTSGMSPDFDRIAANARFNILWSNVQTLHPALYAQPPTVVVKRRYDTQDDVGRAAATILERCITFQMHDQHFHTKMNETLLDYLLAGRGTMWARYVPRFGPPPPVQMPPPPMPSGGQMPPAPPMSAPAGMSAGSVPAAAAPPSTTPPSPVLSGGGAPAPPIGPGAMPPPGPMQPGPPQPAPGPVPAGMAPVGMTGPAGIGGMPPPPFGGVPPPVPPAMPAMPPSGPMAAPLASPMTQPLAAPLGGMPMGGDMPLGGIPIGSITDTDPTQREPLQVANSGETEGTEFLAWEEVALDHVTWDDWLCSPARTWTEVRWVARRVYMTRDELADRFGRAVADDVPLDWYPKEIGEAEALQPENQIFRRAQIYEVWDKPSRKVYWLAYEYGDRLLDERDDPLRLLEFFPTPRPLFATQTTDTLVPVPDYWLYRDQATQIDQLTSRISALSRAIKVSGVYDAAQSDVARIFQEGIENQLIPVNQWGAFAESGGLKGSLDLLDIGMLATVLQQLVEVRAQTKQDLYEVTGISDIIRGTTAATETATAQQLKAGFGTMRLRARQNEVSRFVRDVIRLVGDVVCEHFQPRTMIAMSEIQYSPDAKFAPDAIAMLRDERSRPFRIDMETDSTIMANQQQEQQGRLQFIQTVGGFIGQAMPLVQEAPELGTLVGQLILFGVRSFPQAAELESAFEQAVDQLEQAIKAGQVQKQPDPKQQAAQQQAQMQQAQMQNIQSQIQDRARRGQMDQMRLQSDIADQQADNQRDDQQLQANIGMRRAEGVSKIHERQAGVMMDAAKARAEHGRALLELHGGRVDAAHSFLLNIARMQQERELAEQQQASQTEAA